MTSTAAPIPFAGSMLHDYRHVCAFFGSSQEEYATLLPFVRDGIERGERAYHILPARHRAEHLEHLRSAGIDVIAAQRRRQLDVVAPEDTYLRAGRFNKDAMLALIQDVLETGATLGFPLTRLMAHPEAVLEDWSGVNEFLEYETRLNDVLPSYDDPVLCTYDTNLLNGVIRSRNGDAAEIAFADTTMRAKVSGGVGDNVVLSLRPEALRLLASGEAAPSGWATLAGMLGEVEYLGPVTRFTVQLLDGATIHLMALAPPAASGVVTLAYDPRHVVVMGAPA